MNRLQALTFPRARRLTCRGPSLLQLRRLTGAGSGRTRGAGCYQCQTAVT